MLSGNFDNTTEPSPCVFSGFDKYFVDHTAGVYPIAAAGIPWRAEYIAEKGDILADLHEDLEDGL